MNIPIVSLDKIYIQPDDKNIYFLDCTRVDGSNEIVSRGGISIDDQILLLASAIDSKEIILADDVVFSGKVLRDIIGRFKRLGINVVGIISSICTKDAYDNFNRTLKCGVKTNYLLGEDIIDQVCERDFYFGVAGSGIMIDTGDGFYKAPYFRPYGNPCERASIPKEYEEYFSRGCIERSIYLWEKIDNTRGKRTLIGELAEPIINTTSDDEVVKVLRMEEKRR